jgi:hypothetical protein
MTLTSQLELVSVSSKDAVHIHSLYLNCPTYVTLIGGDQPSLTDVEGELSTLLQDTRRQAQLILDEHGVVGYLDYKVAYPDLHSATISLILIDERLQGRGYGKQVVQQLEQLLSGRMDRIYAVVYGNNTQAKAFWERCGYGYIRDGGPNLGWYLKEL